jgi:multidrug efflux pump subunit AcrA (membrane-fusion protein)
MIQKKKTGAVFLFQKKRKKILKAMVLQNKKITRSRKKFILFALPILFILIVVFATGYYKIVLAENHTAPSTQQETPKASAVEVVGGQEIDLNDELGIAGESYAGEVVSKMDVNVYSPREGVIANLTVGIGDSVWQGQAIGYLSVASEFDQIATTAEKKTEVETSRNRLDAINTQLNDVRNRLNGRKSAAEAAKNAKIANANNESSLGQITSQEKEERIKEAESEYSEVVTDADNEITALTREQKEADKETQAAEALSKTVNGGVDRNIYAVRAGIVSGIFKNVGDYVTGEDRIAAIGITEATLKDRCVRFNIPSNQPPPKVGDLVTITLPGEPFNRQTAKIIGVGTALDDNGQFVAEASFDEIVEWPVHSQVRVQLESVTSGQIFIPLSAVWFDNEGVTSVWIADEQSKITAYNVTTGRAVGDRIEIKDGVRNGDKVVLQPRADFRNGDVIQETGGISNQNTGEEVTPAGYGHDHEH